MKALWASVPALCVLISHPANGQYLRQVGTNLYDFSVVAQSEANCRYYLDGFMAGETPNGIILRPRMRYQFTVAPSTSYMDVEMLAHYNYGYRISNGGRQTITWNDYYHLPREFREFFSEAQPPNITVLHCKADRVEGIAMSIFAIPITSTVWDSGTIPPAGWQTNFSFYYRVLPTGMVRVPIGPPRPKSS
jgi:hypothetical protein